jgi:hypothetical protein
LPLRAPSGVHINRRRLKIFVLFPPEQRHDACCFIVRPWTLALGARSEPPEIFMTKLLALASAIALAALSLVSPAEAGMRVGIGIGGLAIGTMGAIANEGRSSEPSEYRERRKSRAAREDREEKSTRSAKKSKSDKSQKSEDSETASKEKAPGTEASSIAGASGGPAPVVNTGATATASTQFEHSSIALTEVSQAPRTAPVAKKIDTASQSTNGLDCKKFFPSAGMTLSVPCE